MGSFISLLLLGLYYADESLVGALPVFLLAGYMLWRSIAYFWGIKW
jgi:hypothetical protein